MGIGGSGRSPAAGRSSRSFLSLCPPSFSWGNRKPSSLITNNFAGKAMPLLDPGGAGTPGLGLEFSALSCTRLFPSSEHDNGCQVGALAFSSKWCPPRWQWCAAVILLNQPRHSLSEMDWTPQWVRRQAPSSLGCGGCPCALALPSAPGKPLSLCAQSLLARGCSGRPAGIRRGSARNRARNAKCQCQNSGPQQCPHRARGGFSPGPTTRTSPVEPCALPSKPFTFCGGRLQFGCRV